MLKQEVHSLIYPLDENQRHRISSKMSSANETIILPSIAAVVGPENHNRTMIVPTILAGMLMAVGAMVAFGRTEPKKIRESREPPVLPSRIPFIGHLIGMMRWQVGYMQMLRYDMAVVEPFSERNLYHLLITFVAPNAHHGQHSHLELAHRESTLFVIPP